MVNRYLFELYCGLFRFYMVISVKCSVGCLWFTHISVNCSVGYLGLIRLSV